MKRLLARFDPGGVLAQCVEAPERPILWVMLLWFVLVVPAIGLRGAHYEEGTTIGIARGAFEDGHWLAPFLYGERFVERPVLVSWLLGGIGAMVGCLPVWVARLPAVLSLLAGASLIFWLVRRSASPRASLFASVCFLISPMVLQKVVTAEADSVVSTMLFAGFILWWIGHTQGGPTVRRWLAIGGVLTAAALVKGPQPLGFFFLGIGAYLLLQRQWREFLALALCGLMPAAVVGAWYWSVYQPGDLALWQSQSRLVASPSLAQYAGNVAHFTGQLILEWLPAVIIAVPAAVAAVRKRLPGDRDLFVALILYAMVCSAVLVFWPNARTRYAMPGCLAMAAAGIAFDSFVTARSRWAEAAQWTAGCLILYALVLGWLVLPLAPRLADVHRRHGEIVAAILAERPATLYVVPEILNKNVLVYVPAPIRVVPFEEIARLAPPFWALVTPEQEQQMLPPAPERHVVHRLTLHGSDDVRLIGGEKP